MAQDTDVLLSRLQNVDPEKLDSQWKACIELGDIPGARSEQRITEALLRALEPRNFALTRAHAAEVLGKFMNDNDRVIEALIKSMKNDGYQLVRSYATRALGNISKVLDKQKKEDTLILPLVECLNEDPFYGARAEAAEALGTICEKSESEICIYVTKALVASKIEEEKRKRKEPRSGRVQKEVDAAFEKFPRVMNKLRELQADVTKLEQDIKETNEKADRIVLAKGRSSDEDLQSQIEEFNKSKINNDVTARAIRKKLVETVSDIEEDVMPMFMLTIKRR